LDWRVVYRCEVFFTVGVSKKEKIEQKIE